MGCQGIKASSNGKPRLWSDGSNVQTNKSIRNLYVESLKFDQQNMGFLI